MKFPHMARWRKAIHSVQFRFFACIAVASAVFVVVMMLSNVLFFQRYYLQQKKAKLTTIYKMINTEYDGDISVLSDRLRELENRNSVRISILDASGLSLYDTIYQQEQRGQFRSSNMEPFGSIYVYNADELEEKGYTFSQLNEQDGNTVYIALIGRLRTGDTIVLRIPTSALQENQSVNFMFLMISALVAFVACLLAGAFLGRQFTRPITEMKDVANSIAKLDFSKRYSGEYDDEIGELGKSLNQMSDYLESAILDMQHMNEQLQREIEEKQRIDDMRREFIINISHDLKTPIALIQGYAEGLRVGINESEDDKNYYCDIIVDEAKRMNYLVHQLLDLSRIELGNVVPNLSHFDAYELMEAVVEKTQVMWQEKQLHIDLSGIGEQELCADYDMLERAVMNYMTNAIDHTPMGGRICLSTGTDTRHILLAVRNEGESLATEEMDKIWDKFYKLDKSRTRVSGGGSGIGLSIVRAIMRAHHGGCGVRNVEGGVEFYLSLPKTDAARL
ncbi:MAG: HAMP domain-containing sensor histidine kinase [Eubacteriales bacterium]|nr:HAMP domain-containing sensor histidine kinase [Eubacteriales bacterium]